MAATWLRGRAGAPYTEAIVINADVRGSIPEKETTVEK